MVDKSSTYDECVAEINAAEQDVAADYGCSTDELPPDVWSDLADSILRDADREVAREVFRCNVGWAPGWLK